jgi:CubicO group peptidase (beta-lactamase class C family)
MKRARKRVLVGAGAIALVAATAVLLYGSRQVGIGAAFAAKIICSGVFVSQRDAASLLAVDVAADGLAILRHTDVRTDRARREVTATLLGLATRRAVYRAGQGCAVIHGEGAGLPADRIPGATDHALEPQTASDDLDIPGEPPAGLDRGRLDDLLREALSEPDPARPRRTRAVVVLYKNRLLAERYADPFTKDTPLAGWSMTKGVVNALIGILVNEGKIALSDPAPIPQWQGSNDPRRRITIEQLLHMSSGLQFHENYRNPLADAPMMLLGVSDAAAYAAAKPLDAPPGTRWSYASGTSNILSYAMRQIVGDANYLEFPRRALFERIGMRSVELETDESGTFVGSSFMYATARDWARFGLLYLRNGVWSGQRILPEGWVTYTRTPAPAAPDQRYGAHFWLRISKDDRCASDSRPLPLDAFHAVGFEGQYITIIPSRELVVVRLGLTRHPCGWDQQMFVHQVLSLLANEKPATTGR